MVCKLTCKRKRELRQLLPKFCAECGSTENLTIDHVLARSLGGSNERSNLQTLCQVCNNKKAKAENLLLEQLNNGTTPSCNNRKRYKTKDACRVAIQVKRLTAVAANCLLCQGYHVCTFTHEAKETPAISACKNNCSQCKAINCTKKD